MTTETTRRTAVDRRCCTGGGSLPSPASLADVLCFSQLRWDFVYQRPHHLMTRAGRDRRVWYVEEPVFEPDGPRLIVEDRQPGLTIVRPVIPPSWPEADTDAAVSLMLREFVENNGIDRPIAWFYTPMALPWTGWLEPDVTVYDCMDELSAFQFAPPRMTAFEAQLLIRADVVFTGGHSLYEAKRTRHANVHAFPSAVDAVHFRAARTEDEESLDQRGLPSPRIGWFGVIDERMDLDLVAAVADLRPNWSFVLVGPSAKIDPTTIPVRPNLHLVGPRSYAELPRYIAGWNVAIMPFARNASTRFISPTKTLEYLAAGRPVVSTSIQDVVDPFERLGLVRIADTPAEFIDAIEAAMAEDPEPFRASADAFLEPRTWDDTWARMWGLVQEARARHLGQDAHEANSRPEGTAGRAVSAARRR
jgi:glycosyltransferase involved in cell wall biosynthesis